MPTQVSRLHAQLRKIIVEIKIEKLLRIEINEHLDSREGVVIESTRELILVVIGWLQVDLWRC